MVGAVAPSASKGEEAPTKAIAEPSAVMPCTSTSGQVAGAALLRPGVSEFKDAAVGQAAEAPTREASFGQVSARPARGRGAEGEHRDRQGEHGDGRAPRQFDS